MKALYGVAGRTAGAALLPTDVAISAKEAAKNAEERRRLMLGFQEVSTERDALQQRAAALEGELSSAAEALRRAMEGEIAKTVAQTSDASESAIIEQWRQELRRALNH